VRGVVLDMDGTITLPGAIDFAAMRRRIGAPHGTDIIAHVNAQETEEARERLHAILVEEEEIGLQRMALQPHAHDLFAFFHAHGVRRGLLTRNNDVAMLKTVELLRRPDAFHVMLSRSFTPCKPAPDALHHIAGQWGMEAGDLVMVGDSIDDMECGRRAGAATILVCGPTGAGADAGGVGAAAAGDAAPDPHAVALADAVVPSLAELRELLALWMGLEVGGGGDDGTGKP
jgi:HAD superfamily hydrolase (TIGR01549 family)